MTQPQPTQQFTPLFSNDLSISDDLETDAQQLLRHLAVVEQCIRQMAEEINRLEAKNGLWQPDKPADEIARSLLLTFFDDFSVRQPDPTADKTSPRYLAWMCEQVILHKPWHPSSEQWNLAKAHRWIGYIQGVMCARGWSTVQDERDRVRGIESC